MKGDVKQTRWAQSRSGSGVGGSGPSGVGGPGPGLVVRGQGSGVRGSWVDGSGVQGSGGSVGPGVRVAGLEVGAHRAPRLLVYHILLQSRPKSNNKSLQVFQVCELVLQERVLSFVDISVVSPGSTF